MGLFGMAAEIGDWRLTDQQITLHHKYLLIICRSVSHNLPTIHQIIYTLNMATTQTRNYTASCCFSVSKTTTTTIGLGLLLGSSVSLEKIGNTLLGRIYHNISVSRRHHHKINHWTDVILILQSVVHCWLLVWRNEGVTLLHSPDNIAYVCICILAECVFTYQWYL